MNGRPSGPPPGGGSGRPATPPPTSLPPTTSTTPVATQPTPVTPTSTRSRAPGRGRALLGAAVSIALAAGGIIYSQTRDSHNKQRRVTTANTGTRVTVTSASAPTTVATTTTTTELATTVPTIGQGDAGQDITSLGTATASSTYPGNSPTYAVDGDPKTSWFSNGAEPDGTVTYTWEMPSDMLIVSIGITGNEQNPRDSQGFGFDSVTISVTDTNGVLVFHAERQLPGTPDPDIGVQPNARGNRVELVFHGLESTVSGGFAELRVGAAS